MAGSSQKSSIKFEFSKFTNEIPDEFRPIIGIITKARIRISGDSLPSAAIVAGTNEGHLLIFSKGKLVKNCDLCFQDVHKIVIYRHINKEFVVVSSSSGNAAVFDLENLSVVKLWNNVNDLYIKDHFSFGYPQIVLQLKDESSPTIVTSESNWENISPFPENIQDTESPILQSVSLALETQIRNSFLNLLQIQRKISLRKSIVNRSLTILKDQMMNKTTAQKKPSYLMNIVGNNSITSNFQFSCDILKTSAIWHGIINSYWVIGASITNSSDWDLKDIQCMLTTENTGVKYKTCYYNSNYGNPPSSNTNDIHLTNCDVLTAFTCSTLDRRIRSNDSLTIIVVVSIPEFIDSDYEKGNLLFTCSSSPSNQPTKNIQMNLGFVQLKFEELHKRMISIEPTCSDTTLLCRNILAIMSALDAEEVVDFSSSFKSASDSLDQVCEQLKIMKIEPMQCYYGSGVYGHVIITIQKRSTHKLEIKIRAQSTLNVKWVIRSLKSVMGDTVKFNPVEACVVSEPFPFQQNISSVLSLLAFAQCDDELSVIEETAAESVAVSDFGIDLIRKEFRRKQLKLQTINQLGNCNIRYAEYHQWLKTYSI